VSYFLEDSSGEGCRFEVGHEEIHPAEIQAISEGARREGLVRDQRWHIPFVLCLSDHMHPRLFGERREQQLAREPGEKYRLERGRAGSTTNSGPYTCESET
jgi:hypothetical protein